MMIRSFSRHRRLWAAVGGACLLAIVLGGYAGTSSAGGSASNADVTITALTSTAPMSADPHIDWDQFSQSTWLVYTGLYTYAHAAGAAGSKLIPGLATAQPKVSDGGKTYTMTIRKGLTYSNGQPVKATDFPFSIERAIKLNWGGDSYFTTHIVGADAYSSGKASTISGIQADNATGQIVVHLTDAFGPFENVLAEPAAAPMPEATTAMKPQGTNPPAGFGPYMITKVVPNVSYEVDVNPTYAKQAIPGIPVGHVNVNLKVETNSTTEAADVLNGTADVFGYDDAIPPSFISKLPKDRYKLYPGGLPEWFFLNSQGKPFNNQLAREAVAMALDRPALSRLNSGTLLPGCYVIPPGILGRPTAPCPYGNPAKTPSAATIAKAKALVQKAGMAGTKVTVWGMPTSPYKEFTDYYTGLLNQLGFKATTKLIPFATYWSTISDKTNGAQTGFYAWGEDYPNPVAWYLEFNAKAIPLKHNINVSRVNDPFVQKMLAKLNAAPNLDAVAPQWQKLDYYMAKKVYVAVFGYGEHPKFTSKRVDFGALIYHTVYGPDWTSLKLKG